mmetsp:Transcript_12294/g.18333  ORF Transcript_12294/g.18333 Transcript_12294/m.18333 type:complete len:240 (-) Transcript_12294:415-1134(-)
MPVQATAIATVLMFGSRNSPGSPKFSQPGSLIQPSAKHHIIEKKAVVATIPAVIGKAASGSSFIIFSDMNIPTPNPTAWTRESASPTPSRDMLSVSENDAEDDGSYNSRAATPDKHKNAASHVCGASLMPMGFLFTIDCRRGQTSTVQLPRNDTVAGEVSIKAILCDTYPRETNAPPRKTEDRRFGFNCNRNGDKTRAASTIRPDVAALAGRLSFINAPREKFVPYRMAARASMARGPM